MSAAKFESTSRRRYGYGYGGRGRYGRFNRFNRFDFGRGRRRYGY
jgi:hypothetical protein